MVLKAQQTYNCKTFLKCSAWLRVFHQKYPVRVCVLLFCSMLYGFERYSVHVLAYEEGKYRLRFGKTREEPHTYAYAHRIPDSQKSSTICHRVIGTIGRCFAIVVVLFITAVPLLPFVLMLIASLFTGSKKLNLFSLSLSLYSLLLLIMFLFLISFGHFPSLFYSIGFVVVAAATFVSFIAFLFIFLR